ncbi:MAG: hypothetical protein ACLR0U_08585 [Enterocloster clostridioformis]
MLAYMLTHPTIGRTGPGKMEMVSLLSVHHVGEIIRGFKPVNSWGPPLSWTAESTYFCRGQVSEEPVAGC